MKKGYGSTPETREVAVRIAMSIKDEDIDLSDMPETGGVTEWRHGKNRVTYSKNRENHRSMASVDA
jgi:hypothetical protein